MLNDREDKYEDPEESEYHFSDEEVSYEVEPESPKPTNAAAGTKENILSRLTASKRMIISLVVFLVLVFIVYKMVAPNATTEPTTEIAPAAVTAQAPNVIATAPNQAMSAAQAPVPTEGGANANMSAALQSMSSSGATPTAAAATGTAPLQPEAQGSPLQAQMPSPPQAQAQPQQAPNGANAGLTGAIAPVAAQASGFPMQPQAVSQTTTTEVTTTGMPAIMPVQSATPTLPQQMPAGPGQAPLNAEAKVAPLGATNDKLVGQLQAEYVQRLNDYSSQNKTLQDQVQTLNARMASMETQMGQLIQALTRQNANASPPPQSVPAQPQAQAGDSKVAYNVQAIIPGRAWLRSDSGDTLTVAEGDMVKDLGRISKIDPYDGVVEINTGTKVISLTYGSGE